MVLLADKNLLEIIKTIAVDSIEATKPMSVVFGTVVKRKPLEIKINQKLILTKNQLALTRNVTDYTLNMSVNHMTENHEHTHVIHDTYTSGGSASVQSHHHEYKGEKEFVVHNSLQIGETVLMLRMQEGQKYIVIDRMVRM